MRKPTTNVSEENCGGHQNGCVLIKRIGWQNLWCCEVFQVMMFKSWTEPRAWIQAILASGKRASVVSWSMAKLTHWKSKERGIAPWSSCQSLYFCVKLVDHRCIMELNPLSSASNPNSDWMANQFIDNLIPCFYQAQAQARSKAIFRHG